MTFRMSPKAQAEGAVDSDSRILGAGWVPVIVRKDRSLALRRSPTNLGNPRPKNKPMPRWGTPC